MENRWFVGPEFLEKDEDEWPSLTIAALDAGDVEIKKRPIFIGLTLVETDTINWARISS